MSDAPAPAATAARPILARVGHWALARADEPSTWTGLAAAAAALGYSALGQHLTSLADVAPMIIGVLGVGIATASTSTNPPTTLSADAPPAPSANPPLALPAPPKENTMSLKTFLVQAEDTAIAALKSAGTIIEHVVLTEGQKIVAEAKQTDLGTLALNTIQTLESSTMSGTDKMEVVVASVAAAVPKFVASGGISGLITTAEDFAIEFGQSIYNDLKADLAKVVAPAATTAAA